MIFVTGGTGFLGTHLLRELVSRGKNIRALKRINSAVFLEKEIAGKIEWVDGDVMDIPSLEVAMENCDEVYHCAAKVSFRQKDINDIMRVNIEGTANIVNVALAMKIRKMVYASSVAAIGERENEIINENVAWENNRYHSNYALSKYLAEREVWRAIAEGLNAVIINPTLIIGEGNWNMGPPRFFSNVWKGMILYSRGVNGFVAAKDVVQLMIMLMESEIQNERFIINAENWSYKDFFSLIADTLEKKRPYLNVLPWMTELIWRLESVRSKFIPLPHFISKETARIAQSRYYFDNTKIKNAIPFEFTPVQKCIEATAMKFMEEMNEGKSKR